LRQEKFTPSVRINWASLDRGSNLISLIEKKSKYSRRRDP